jgi:hypothetical protein
MKEVKYFSIENDLNPKIVGKDFSQIGYMKPNSEKLSSWKFPNKNIKFELELNDNSKLTDFLKNSSVHANGFFISSKTKSVLDNFNLMNHKYYKANLTFEGTNNNYYWLHLRDKKIVEIIDYRYSEFFETEFNRKINTINLDSFNKYETMKKEKSFKFGVKISQIVLNENSFKNLDLFTVLPFDNNIYISERLLNSLNSESISGFRINKSIKINLV